MATVTRENIGVLNDKIVVKVAKDDYLPSFEKALKNYSKQANIPGFRKGMVPVGMVKKMYGSSVFSDEVIRSVEKGLTDYMVNEKLEIFAQPLPVLDSDRPSFDMNNPSEYAFAFEVGLKPAFLLPDLSSAAFTRYKVIVTDEMIDEEVTRLQVRNGTMTEPDTVTNDENVLNVSFTECDENGIAIENGIKKDNSLLVKYFSEAFRSKWMGKAKGDELVLQLSTAFDEKEREWMLKDLGLDEAGADKFFSTTITKLGFVEKSPLNEDFFKQVFPASEAMATEAEFREAIKADIQKQWDAQSRNQLMDQIYHQLIDHTRIEFPESFLKRWMQNGGEQAKTPEQVDTEYPSFVNSLKWTLIIDRLVKDNNVQVLPEDIKAFAKNQLLGYMGGQIMDTEQPWMNDYIERMMKDKKFVEDSFHRIQTEKAFAWAETQVNATEKAIAAEDFTKMQNEHHH